MTNRSWSQRVRSGALGATSLWLALRGDATVRAQPATCATDASVTGFDTIQGLNDYMSLVWQYVDRQLENAPSPPYYFLLCPQTLYTDAAIFPRLNDTLIFCGNRGAVEDGCTLGGEANHILLSHVEHDTEPTAPAMQRVTFAGLSMANSKDSSVKAFAPADATVVFYNCMWLNNAGESAVYLAKTLPSEPKAMSVEIYQSSFVNSVFSLGAILNNEGSLLIINSAFANLVNAYGSVTSFNAVSTIIAYSRFTKTTNYATLPIYGGSLALKNVVFSENTNAFSTVYVSSGGKLQASNCTFEGNQNGVSNGILDGMSTLVLNEVNTGNANTGITNCDGFLTVAQGSFCSKELSCPGDCCAFDDSTCDTTTATGPTPSPTTSSPTVTPLTCPELDPNTNYFCPTTRYCPWNVFSRQEKDVFINALGYTRRSWNYIREENPIESLRFSDLNETARQAYADIGFNERSHDCCNHHYASYAWSEFDPALGYGDVLFALEAMGYDEDSWTKGERKYDGVAWADLPEPVREALISTLCYNEQLWNKEPFPWPADVVLPNGNRVTPVPTKNPTPPPAAATPVPTSDPATTTSPTKAGTPDPTTSPTTTSAPTFEGCRPKFDELVYFCPFERYCEWDYHSPERRTDFRTVIGYTGPTWNFQETSPVDELSFEGLTETQRGGLLNLGFDEDRHDCCQNHYNDYDWSDFDPNDGYGPVLQALKALGYNEIMWQNSIAAAYERFGWDDLPEEARWAAEELCYSKETWDQVDLTMWPLDADLPGVYWAKSGGPTPSPRGSSPDGGSLGGTTGGDVDVVKDEGDKAGGETGDSADGGDSSSSASLYGRASLSRVAAMVVAAAVLAASL